MSLKKFACLASLALAFAGSLSAAQGRWEQWLNAYYQNPQPADVVKAVYGLNGEGYFDNDANIATGIGFFSGVFSENPEKVDRWFASFRDLPVNARRLLACALWSSGDVKGERVLRKAAATASLARRAGIERMIATPAQPLEAVPVLSVSSMNLQWGAFLATGAEQNVTGIFAAIGRGDLASDARASLAFNAVQHERVLEICRAQLSKQPNEVRSVLRAVINEAQTRKQPTT